jgi:nitrogenase-associated protein
MTHIVFYEKPGCGGNAKQRAALEAAGHTLTRRSLLDAGWTSGTLMPYLAELPVPQWFNRAAPRVKSGEIVPEALNADAALALLLAEPLLIRRPLMQRPDGARLVGFETDAVDRFVGLAPVVPGAAATDRPASLEGCAAVKAPCPSR